MNFLYIALAIIGFNFPQAKRNVLTVKHQTVCLAKTHHKCPPPVSLPGTSSHPEIIIVPVPYDYPPDQPSLAPDSPHT